uniref:Uncharacterized protein n=1 Tax=Brassica oleracea TaxID=3712 RepID=A0A3P6BEP6_BRAOL|nr:unnamed protein product [Brassica oleracea]
MPKIDVTCLNPLRPQPKPSANLPETTSTHSDDAAEPMEVDKAPMGRTLRKRKGKVAKHLKREANEKEMESFQKRMFGHGYRGRPRPDPVTQPPCRTAVPRPERREHIRSSQRHHSHPSQTSIHEFAAKHPHPPSPVYVKIDRHSDSVIDRHQETDINPSTSIDIDHTTSIDIRPIPKSIISKKAKFDKQYLTPDEFGIFRDPDGYARAIDGRTLHVSREDIADIF